MAYGASGISFAGIWSDGAGACPNRPYAIGCPSVAESAPPLPGRSPAESEVLIASPYVPFPLSHGGAVRMYNLMRRAAGWIDQILVCFTETADPPPAELLEICAQDSLGAPHRQPLAGSWQPPRHGGRVRFARFPCRTAASRTRLADRRSRSSNSPRWRSMPRIARPRARSSWWSTI